MNTEYDIIICGAGCAGLSLAYRLAQDRFRHLNILILDPDTKSSNDRTWCYWEDGAGMFDPITHKSWDQVQFYSDHFEKVLQLSPYEYKMIRGIDFYNYTKQHIKKYSNIKWHQETVLSISEVDKRAHIRTDKHQYQTQQCFRNYLDYPLDKDKKWYVDQHFGGWTIETTEDAFDPAKATFMDFRIPQEGEARFFYVLPTSKRKALVELAIFSNELMSQPEYDRHIQQYIRDYLNIEQYHILEREYGVIPMTSHDFTKSNQCSSIVNIGTAAGAVKASSGYAFYRIQEQSDYLIECIELGLPIQEFFKPNRFSFYDKIMLNVLLSNKVAAAKVFTLLFKKLPAHKVLSFLNEKTSFLQELHIFSAPPWWPFTKAMSEEIL